MTPGGIARKLVSAMNSKSIRKPNQLFLFGKNKYLLGMFHVKRAKMGNYSTPFNSKYFFLSSALALLYQYASPYFFIKKFWYCIRSDTNWG